MKIHSLLPISVFAFLACATVRAQVTVPSGLAPGSQYRLAFVTSQFTNAEATDIGTYNTFVTNVADAIPELAVLGASWYAIANTASVDAATNIGSPNTPIYNTAGQLVSTTTSAFFTTNLSNPVEYNESGVLLNTADVFTGYGGGENANGPHYLGASFPELGSSNATAGIQWLDNTFARPSDLNGFYYGISSTLTVPSSTPEPSTVLLVSSALVLWGFCRRITSRQGSR